MANSGTVIAITPNVPSLLLDFAIVPLSWPTHMPWRGDRQRPLIGLVSRMWCSALALRRCGRETSLPYAIVLRHRPTSSRL
jgi:hypothetical protein